MDTQQPQHPTDLADDIPSNRNRNSSSSSSSSNVVFASEAGTSASSVSRTSNPDQQQQRQEEGEDQGLRSSDNNDTNENFVTGQSSDDAVAKGLSTMLASVIKDFDSRAHNTIRSQDQLDSAVDRLTRELDRLLEEAPLPFILQQAAKISSVRKRVASLNSVLKSIQRRVDNIDRVLSAGLTQEKTTSESS